MYDSEVMDGARNAVRVCMNVQEEDRVFIFTDTKTEAVGQALADASAETGAEVKVILLEDHTTRPVTEVPESLVAEFKDFAPTVTFYAASSLPGEITFRMQLGQQLRESSNPRHGHMPSINERLMREGMRADYDEVYDLTMKVFDRVKSAKTINVTSTKGTDVTAIFSPDINWIACHGRYHYAGAWGNLPEGEVFTCPERVDGVIVADILGDYFSPKYGVLDTPVTFHLKHSRVERIECANGDLAAEVWDYLQSDGNSNRAGEFAIGTNTAIPGLTGNLLQDEKIPGLHVAFGNPYPERTGADWSSRVHVDVIPVCCTITVDGEPIMVDGEYQL